MLKEHLFTDVKVTIVANNGNDCEHSVDLDLHRPILAHRCGYFRGMFIRTSRESDEENVTVHVAEGSTVEAMVQVVEYLKPCTQVVVTL